MEEKIDRLEKEIFAMKEILQANRLFDLSTVKKACESINMDYHTFVALEAELRSYAPFPSNTETNLGEEEKSHQTVGTGQKRT